MDEDLQEDWLERAAIMQFDGNKPRHSADFDALACALIWLKSQGRPPPHGEPSIFATFQSTFDELFWNEETGRADLPTHQPVIYAGNPVDSMVCGVFVFL